MDAILSGLSGIRVAQKELDAVAHKMVQQTVSQQDVVDLSAAAVGLVEAQNENAAGVAVVRTANEIDRAVLKMLG